MSTTGLGKDLMPRGRGAPWRAAAQRPDGRGRHLRVPPAAARAIRKEVDLVRLIATSEAVLRRDPDGAWREHAVLYQLRGWHVVDGPEYRVRVEQVLAEQGYVPCPQLHPH